MEEKQDFELEEGQSQRLAFARHWKRSRPSLPFLSSSDWILSHSEPDFRYLEEVGARMQLLELRDWLRPKEELKSESRAGSRS